MIALYSCMKKEKVWKRGNWLDEKCCIIYIQGGQNAGHMWPTALFCADCAFKKINICTWIETKFFRFLKMWPFDNS